MSEWASLADLLRAQDEEDEREATRLEGLRRMMEEEWHAGDEEQD